MDARRANDRIADRAEQLRFVSRVPMLCECSARDCRTIVMIGLSDYRDVRSEPDAVLVAPGHAVEGGELLEQTDGYGVVRTSPRRGNGGRRSA